MFYVTFDGQATNKCILIDTYLIEFLPQIFLKVLNFVTCILLSVIRNVRKTTTFIDWTYFYVDVPNAVEGSNLNIVYLTFIFKNLEPVFYVQWNLCNLTPEFFILWHPIKIYDPKVFLLTKIKHEYFHILYNPTYFLGPLVCQIRQVPLYHYSCVFLCGSGTGLSLLFAVFKPKAHWVIVWKNTEQL